MIDTDVPESGQGSSNDYDLATHEFDALTQRPSVCVAELWDGDRMIDSYLNMDPACGTPRRRLGLWLGLGGAALIAGAVLIASRRRKPGNATQRRRGALGFSADEHLNRIEEALNRIDNAVVRGYEALEGRRCDLAIGDVQSATYHYGRASAHQFAAEQPERYRRELLLRDSSIRRLSRQIEGSCRWIPTRERR